MILHRVLTAEQVPFHYRVAGMGVRLLAWATDILGVFVLVLAGALVGAVLDQMRPGVGQAVTSLWVFCLMWGYFLLFEWLWQGQTPGKRLLGIRVIDLRGTRVSFYQSAVRNILRTADWMPLCYGLGFLVAAANNYQRRLGDLAAGTLVVHVDRGPSPLRPWFTAERREAGDADAAVLRRLAELDPAQRQALLDLCLRRDRLGLRDRARLFRTVAVSLRRRLGLAKIPDQSDEKFVLHLVMLIDRIDSPSASSAPPPARPPLATSRA